MTALFAAAALSEMLMHDLSTARERAALKKTGGRAARWSGTNWMSAVLSHSGMPAWDHLVGAAVPFPESFAAFDAWFGWFTMTPGTRSLQIA